MLAELSRGGVGKRGHPLGPRHCGIAVSVFRFPQQVEGLDDVIALAPVGLAPGALEASQETVDAKRQRVTRGLGYRGLFVHVPTTVHQMSLFEVGGKTRFGKFAIWRAFSWPS
jgi:hypothetical protein